MEKQGFEELLFAHDASTGLKAVIAIHSTILGPALGGTRMWPYPTEEAAVNDVMRLARGMTYKAAMADRDLGGGKAVIIGDPCRDKSEKLLRAYGRFVDKLGGRYITAEDMGIGEKDLDWVRQETAHVLGDSSQGSPSPFTAYGVWRGIKASARDALGSDSLEGLTVAVQGLGGVGSRLCEYLAGEGARLIVADLDPEKVKGAVSRWAAKAVAPEEIHARECDIFAPCAAGGIINELTIPQLKCRIVAGAANNVLQDRACGAGLMNRGILYAPDYVINAGGLIYVDSIRLGLKDPDEIRRVVGRIEQRLTHIFKRSAAEKQPPEVVADLMAEERLQSGAKAAPTETWA